MLTAAHIPVTTGLTAKPDGEGIMGYGATDYDDGYGWREREGEVGGERESAQKRVPVDSKN